MVKKSVDTHNKPTVYPSNALTIIHADGQIELYYNITVSTSNKPEVNVVKFAGRKRQTVGFGVGGYQTWKIDCTIITDATDLETNAETEIRELPEKGVCILRFPDGRRAQVYVTNVEVGRPEYGGVMRPVSIDCEEVA